MYFGIVAVGSLLKGEPTIGIVNVGSVTIGTGGRFGFLTVNGF